MVFLDREESPLPSIKIIDTNCLQLQQLTVVVYLQIGLVLRYLAVDPQMCHIVFIMPLTITSELDNISFGPMPVTNCSLDLSLCMQVAHLLYFHLSSVVCFDGSHPIFNGRLLNW